MEEEDKLFENVMKGNWDEVAEAYKRNSALQNARITKSRDTALHLAVSYDQADVVVRLVEIIGQNPSKVLHIKNERGNTPLHLAAALGNVQMCYCMAKQDPDLIRARNSEMEPLFSCQLFLARKRLSSASIFFIYKHIKKLTIACVGKRMEIPYFTLPLLVNISIIRNYPNLVSSFNEVGLTPLHVLASEPNAFNSGCHLRPLARLIYRCMLVDKLQEEKLDPEKYTKNPVIERSSTNYPKIYETCMNLFQVFRRSFQLIGGRAAASQKSLKDEENPKQMSMLSNGTNLPIEKEKRHFYPPNYAAAVKFAQCMFNIILIILGFGVSRIKSIRAKKERHIWATQIMDELVGNASMYRYRYNGLDPHNGSPPLLESEIFASSSSLTQIQDTEQKANGHELRLDLAPEEIQKLRRKETPILVAARKGVTDIVDKILTTFPAAIYDLDSDNKNAILLAVEHRQVSVYNLLMEKIPHKESVFRQLDREGNSALHLAAKFGGYRPWLIPGTALQMQWEIKWYKYVRNSMPPHFFVGSNNQGKTPKEIFAESHKDLLTKGTAWLTKTAESCSVVAALIATVAFATSASVPGGTNEENGSPTLRNETSFNVFAIASLVALCSSVTALVFFLTILTSRFQESDFAMDLPKKLFLGLTSLFTSIASMLLSFCAGHVFILKANLRYAAYPLYIATGLPVTYFALSQLSLYFDLVKAILKKEPQRRYKHKVSYSHSIYA